MSSLTTVVPYVSVNCVYKVGCVGWIEWRKINELLSQQIWRFASDWTRTHWGHSAQQYLGSIYAMCIVQTVQKSESQHGHCGVIPLSKSYTLMQATYSLGSIYVMCKLCTAVFVPCIVLFSEIFLKSEFKERFWDKNVQAVFMPFANCIEIAKYASDWTRTQKTAQKKNLNIIRKKYIFTFNILFFSKVQTDISLLIC